MDSLMIERASFVSSSVITNGGANLIMFSCVGFACSKELVRARTRI